MTVFNAITIQALFMHLMKKQWVNNLFEVFDRRSANLQQKKLNLYIFPTVLSTRELARKKTRPAQQRRHTNAINVN